MSQRPARMISEYSRILSQILSDVMEHNYLLGLGKLNLSKTQFSILKLLNSAGSFKGSELSNILNISRPAVSKNIDKLVQHKLASRTYPKKDRRTMEIHILKNGRDIVENFESLRLQKQEQALAKFSAQEQQQLADLLGRYVRRCMDQEDMLDLICLQCDDAIAGECLLKEQQLKCQYYLKKRELADKS